MTTRLHGIADKIAWYRHDHACPCLLAGLDCHCAALSKRVDQIEGTDLSTHADCAEVGLVMAFATFAAEESMATILVDIFAQTATRGSIMSTRADVK